MSNIQYKKFAEINLQDSFFDGLREDYPEFDTWYQKKSIAGESAYVLNEGDKLVCFVYLKIEDSFDEGIIPPLESKKWVKIGTFKIVARSTKLGERLIKRAFDFAISQNIFDLYVTIYDKHSTLIQILKRYGFVEHGKKKNEIVLTKHIISKEDLHIHSNKTLNPPIDLSSIFPTVLVKNTGQYLLSIYPEYHTRMFPESKLNTESNSVLCDISESNSIHKIYLSRALGIQYLNKGDLIVIYRTKDKSAPSAHYSSVATSLCVVEEYKNIDAFQNEKDFIDYCKPYNVFSSDELKGYYKAKRYPHIIKMTYNIAFDKRITLKRLREIIPNVQRWTFVPLNIKQFHQIMQEAKINDSIIIH